ncbi:MAG: hypothetical protein AVDCRST_MAG17-25 [uncultured Solirubrobacterales bacterium]|uniref:Uncharacterized protein n=1 Tax=uncultured Solirubrobacterales bacterium TaxID=768556 RepID=A0A6J4RYX0_9ACTN|nr:MAG: hypothetical protein AVDCRST_MAG17-25 [uncultured Solirubrobacterales bacterium]
MAAIPRPSSPAVRSARSEGFDEFLSLPRQEVLRRAEEAETRSVEKAPLPDPCAKAAWRRLYREMRRSRAASVANLRRQDVERHASMLGYGYFRIRVNSRDGFMPLPG